MVFPVVMYGCESWTIKIVECQKMDAFALWCWRRLLRAPWTTRGSNQSILKESQLWIFIGRTDAEVEAPILWPPDGKSWLIRKDPDAGKDWRQEKGTTEDEMVGWHHWLNEHEFEQAPGDSLWQRSLGAAVRYTESQSQIHLSDWTTIKILWWSHKELPWP